MGSVLPFRAAVYVWRCLFAVRPLLLHHYHRHCPAAQPMPAPGCLWWPICPKLLATLHHPYFLLNFEFWLLTSTPLCARVPALPARPACCPIAHAIHLPQYIAVLQIAA